MTRLTASFKDYSRSVQRSNLEKSGSLLIGNKNMGSFVHNAHPEGHVNFRSSPLTFSQISCLGFRGRRG